jgi:apolipoprotein N-acyltransferase
MAGSTPYIRFGNLLFLASSALLLAGAWLLGRGRRRARENKSD